MEPFERLQKARKKAGYETAAEAARAYGWGVSTYISHENGTRGIRPQVAERYGKAFKLPASDLIFEPKRPNEKTPAKQEARSLVPLVGFVAAGAEAHYFGDGNPIDEVQAPLNRSDETVAVEVRGESLGSVFNQWLVYYDDVQRPVSHGLIARLCVVGLKDGRIMVKQLQPSRVRGRFHLISNTEPPIFDAEVEWAAKVIGMAPR